MGQHKTFNSAFKSMYKKMESVQKTLPSVLANTGTNFFIGNFDKEGFDDGGLKKWKTPERKIQGTPSFKYPKTKGLGRRTRKTLIQTGKLKRAVNKSVTEKSFKRIVWRINPSEVPYASVHNKGLKAGRGNGFMMPKREYMGRSRTLDKLFRVKIIQAYKKTFNG